MIACTFHDLFANRFGVARVRTLKRSLLLCSLLTRVWSMASAAEETKSGMIFSVTDDHLLLSPYVWKFSGTGSEARADAMMPGAYLKAVVQGTSSVGLLVDGTANEGSVQGGMPIVDFSIDQGEFKSVQLSLKNEVYVLPLADGLKSDVPHQIDVVFRAGTLNARWETTKPHLRIAGLQVQEGGKLLSGPRRPKNAIVFGDSITEGVLAEGKGPYYADLFLNNARVTWAPVVCAALQCEYGQLGTGGHGMVKPIQIPPLPKTWDRYDATSSRLSNGRLLPEPDYVLCLIGTNDSEIIKPDEVWKLIDITEAYTDWLNAMRNACPNSAIFCITPPLGLHAAEITAAVKTRHHAGDQNVHLVDTSPLQDKFISIIVDASARTFGIKQHPTQLAGDGVHPSVAGNAVLGAFVAAEISRQLSVERR
jgi:lysophospholipase L1-like esterase